MPTVGALATLGVLPGARSPSQKAASAAAAKPATSIGRRKRGGGRLRASSGRSVGIMLKRGGAGAGSESLRRVARSTAIARSDVTLLEEVPPLGSPAPASTTI